jgi:NAD(P)-dependent dehydrogenase (short-subunit alcohol dehydrogenase family)
MNGAILVTGASTGIGEATALRLARRGHTVYAGVRRPEDSKRLEASADGELRAVRLDVTDEAEIRLVAAELEGEPLRGLVNNAGVVIAGPVEALALEEWRAQLEVNLIGQVAVTKAFLPNLRAAAGRIVNVTSIGGRVVTPFYGPYVAAKFGLEAVTDALRMELLPWGVDVIAVEPGSIKTEIWAKGDEMAGRIRAGLDEDSVELYGEALDAAQKTTARTGRRGIKPDRAARVIEKALTARHPRPRYLVGLDAYGMVAMRRLLPTRLADRLYTRGMGLPRGLR